MCEIGQTLSFAATTRKASGIPSQSEINSRAAAGSAVTWRLLVRIISRLLAASSSNGPTGI